jgi:hypothetical protein
MKRKTIKDRKLAMEKVKTKVWKVRLKVPVEIPENNIKENVKTINWSFKLMLN